MNRFSLSCVLSLVLSLHLFADPNVTNFIDFTLVQNWDVADAVEFDAGDESVDGNTQSLGAFTPFTAPDNIGLLEHLYGDISGNTISRADFKAAVAAAYDDGLGGVIDFEDSNRSFGGGDYVHPTAGVIALADRANLLRAGNITIARGPTMYVEGGDSPVGPYKGKQDAEFDGTGPSPAAAANFDELYFFATGDQDFTSELGSKAMVTLANSNFYATSFDLDFDPADRVGIVGFAFLVVDYFQSYQQGYVNYPNMHAIATFTDGVTPVTQMAVAVSQQSSSHDHYFGFRAPAGFYLDRLQVYQIGNNDRALMGIDDIGFVQVLPDPGLSIDLVDNGGTDEVELSFTAEADLQYQIKSSEDITLPLGGWTDEGAPISGVSGPQTENFGAVAPDQEFFLIDMSL